MRKTVRKPIAVLLSVLMVLTAFSVGFVTPAFAVDTTALDAAVADANALTAADYVDFSGVTAAVNAAADTAGKTQNEIDDMEDAIRVAIAKLETVKESANATAEYYSDEENRNMDLYMQSRLNAFGADTATSASFRGEYGGQPVQSTTYPPSTWDNMDAYRFFQGDSIDSVAQTVKAVYNIDRYKTTNLSQLGNFISAKAGKQGSSHYFTVFLSKGDGNDPYWIRENNPLTVVSNKGQSITYTITSADGRGLAHDWCECSTVHDITSPCGISGNIPDAGDSVAFLFGISNIVMGYSWGAVHHTGFIALYINAYDTTNLRTAMAFTPTLKSNYTAASYAAYRTALDAASTVLNKANPTQDVIDAATTALNNAINGLQSTITINGNGGTVLPETLNVTFGSNSTVAFPANDVTATRAGYDLAWDKDTVTFNDTVTAQWTARTDTAYTVNHYYMDATGSYDVEPVSEGKTGTTDTDAVYANLLSVPEHFTYDAATTGATSANIDGTGDAVINLYYARDQYTVSFVSGATGATLKTQTVYYEADATAPDAPAYVQKDADDHYKFTGWDEDFTNISGDLTVTALYEEEGHDFGAFAFADEDNHERTCANCDYVETESHNYLFDSFVWSADNTSAQAKLICEHCGDEKLVDAAMSEDAHAAECEKDAYTVYTAAYGDESDSKTVTAEGTALEHNYLFDSFVWSADNTTAQAKLICEHCRDEKLVNAEMSEDAHAAECEKDAYTVYTATYGDESDSRTVTAEDTALEHNYLFDSFVWSADNTSAQAKVICEHCRDEKLVAAEMSEDAHAAECEKDAYTVYTATYGGETDSKTVTAEGTALEHNYLLDSFVWSADNSSAQAKVICEHCRDEKLVDAAMSEDVHAAECEKDAYTVYTATYGDESDSKTVTAEGTALAHSFIYISNGDGTHAVTCANCDYSASADCEYDETSHAATCVEGAYITYTCKDCGYSHDGEKGEPDPSNHVGAIHTVGAVAATADEDGYTGDKVCSACGETVETGTVIPAGSETPDEPDTPDAPDTPADGETEGFHCAYCGKIHPKTFTGWIIYIFHMLAAIIRSLTPVAAGAVRL